MSSIDSLNKRIDRMLEQLKPLALPKQWYLLAEPGQEIPASILAQIGSNDTVLIREVPPGFLDENTDLPRVVWWKSGGRYVVPGGEGEGAV